MPRNCLSIISLICLTLFIAPVASADWLDKLKDTAKELTDKAGEALKEAAPESPTTSDGEGQIKKPATATAPAQPAAPTQSTVAVPSAPKTTAPAPAAPTGNNDKALVMATQTELKRLGYKIGVDGAYGPNTRKQIISFQNSKAMAATGDVTTDLVSALKATPTPNAEPAATTTTAAPAPKAEEKQAKPAAAAAEKEKSAAHAATLSPEGKMVFEGCEGSSIRRTYYSCQCIAENTERFIGPAIANQTKHWKQRITGYEGAIKTNDANANFTAEKKAQLESGMRQKITQAEGEIARLGNRAGWDDATRHSMVQSAELQLYKESACKIGDGMREKEYDACLRSSNSKNIKGKSPEEYCSCSADTAAKLWTSSNQTYSSKVAVGLPVQARGQCRK